MYVFSLLTSNLFIHSGYGSFIRDVFCKYLFSVYDVSFYFLSSVFQRTEIFHFNKGLFISFFSFMDHDLVSYLNNLCLTLPLSFRSSSYIFWVHLLLGICVLNIFSQAVACISIFFNGEFLKKRVFNFPVC